MKRLREDLRQLKTLEEEEKRQRQQASAAPLTPTREAGAEGGRGASSFLDRISTKEERRGLEEKGTSLAQTFEGEGGASGGGGGGSSLVEPTKEGGGGGGAGFSYDMSTEENWRHLI
jgi:hypothetical protein